MKKDRKTIWSILSVLLVLALLLVSGCDAIQNGNGAKKDPEKIRSEYEEEISKLNSAQMEKIKAGTVLGTLNGKDVILGKTISMGTLEQDGNEENGPEPVEWRVLEVKEGKALLISNSVLAFRKYHPHQMNHLQWENSEMRTWLNSEFLGTVFTDAESARIPATSLGTKDCVRSRFYPEEFSHLRETSDRIFLIDRDDALIYFRDSEDRKADVTKTAEEELLAAVGPEEREEFDTGRTGWFLRYHPETTDSSFIPGTPGQVLEYMTPYWVADVDCNGDIGMVGDASKTTGVRPALWVTLDP